jgi:NAD(P)H-hydrate repair Nnr-like enzyme with NAD(P)H-hydrate dehydratase domain
LLTLDENRDLLTTALKGTQARLLGSGLGQSEKTCTQVAFLLHNAECPIILDADGLIL